MFRQLRQIVSESAQVIVLADREFGTLKHMSYLKETLGFEYILRIKRSFTVTDKHRENKKLAQEWLKENEQTCVEDGYLTVKAYPVK